MQWLNYHHLYYFWHTARERSVVAAATKLKVRQPTVSQQLKELETAVGEKLFQRRARSLVLTETGRLVFSYAEQIFELGEELKATINGPRPDRAERIRIGIPDSFPKQLVFQIISPILKQRHDLRLTCFESPLEKLLSQLALGEIELVISDEPARPHSAVNAHSYKLGDSDIGIFGVKKIIAKYKTNFPAALNGAPFLLQTSSAKLRLEIERWFVKHRIAPKIVGEFEDSALMKVFAQNAMGLVVMPMAVERALKSELGLELLAKLSGVKEQVYVIVIDKMEQNTIAQLIAKSGKKLLKAR